MRKTIEKSEVRDRVYYWMRFYFSQYRKNIQKGQLTIAEDYKQNLAGVLQVAQSLNIFTESEFEKINHRIWFM